MIDRANISSARQRCIFYYTLACLTMPIAGFSEFVRLVGAAEVTKLDPLDFPGLPKQGFCQDRRRPPDPPRAVPLPEQQGRVSRVRPQEAAERLARVWRPHQVPQLGLLLLGDWKERRHRGLRQQSKKCIPSLYFLIPHFCRARNSLGYCVI